MEREPLFLLALERLQTLYPRAYARGATSRHKGSELDDTSVKLSARTHPGTTGINTFLGVGDPYPTRPSSLVGVMTDESPVTRKFG